MDHCIVHVYGGSPKKYGSLEEYFFCLTDALRAKGYRTIFVFNRIPEENLFKKYKDVGSKIVVLPATNKRFDWTLIKYLYKLFKKEKAEIVNSHFGRTGFNAIIAAWLAKVPVKVWTKHSLQTFTYQGIRLPAYRTWLSLIFLTAYFADRVIAVSQAVRRELLDIYHVRDSKAVQIYLGINNSRFREVNGGYLKKELNLNEDERIVTCISQARHEKGVEYFIRAAAIVKKRNDRVTFLHVGGGPLEDEIKKLAAKLEVDGKVRFLGVRNDVPEIISISDFTILPSLTEAAPLALMESLAAGKTIIASNVGGIPEFIADNKNGFLVPPANENILAEKILELTDSKEKLRELSLGAYERSKEFSVVRGVENTINIYLETKKVNG